MNHLKVFTLSAAIILFTTVQFPKQLTTRDFLQCVSAKNSSRVVHAKDSSSLYTSLLQKSQQNPRWLNSSLALQPHFIVTPSHEHEIRAAILCSRERGLQVRVRSWGHDYEGLSYLSKRPFVLVDLVDLRQITIDMEDQMGWVQSGATLRELYYSIAKKSGAYGFLAGVCPTVGLGGHISGSGFGALTRKYGLAADHVVDARLVDVNGRVLDRKLMGEELFWAIRGGGGASFGIISAWKIKLVPVPSTIAVFTVHRTLKQGAIKLVNQWQKIADKLPEDLFIRVIIQNIGGRSYGVKKTVQASFQSMFLGKTQRLIPLMKQSFPDLRVDAKDCTEMSWIESVMSFAGHQRGTPQEVLLKRDHELYKSYFKVKSDFVTQPITETVLEQAWNRHLQVDIAFMIMEPLGGRMNSIPETQIAFTPRKGNIYNIQYIVKWKLNEAAETKKHIHWIRMLYSYMTPYVSKVARAPYLNYRDLDLGINGNNGTTSYLEATVWGTKYFKNNFERLAKVKSQVDPSNFFRDEQSIPPFGLLRRQNKCCMSSSYCNKQF